MTRFLVILLVCLVATVSSFQPQQQQARSPTALHSRAKFEAAMGAALTASVPIIAQAVEDDYEYGAVDAPIGLAWGVGLLAILTAAVPVLLAPGEKALEEMRENEGNSFGSGKSLLNKRK